MYLQITTRCNMSCAHCCFACTNKGEDMPENVWRAALNLAKEYDSPIAIGGGEPTLHEDFEKILCFAMMASKEEEMRPFIVTNGTHVERSRLLHGLTVGKMVSAHLSYDQYHDMDMVDSDIFELFYNDDLLWGKGTRGPGTVHASGRGKRIEGAVDECPCSTMFVKPNGDIYHCGCDDAPKIGDVFNGVSEAPCDCHKLS